MDMKQKVNGFFAKLPFRAMAEKIPPETRAKAPVLNKVIPWANQIACGLAVVLVIVLIACSGGKKDGGSASAGNLQEAAGAVASAAKAVGKATPATDFGYDLSEDGKGVVITKYTGKGGAVVIPAQIEGLPVVAIGSRVFYGEDNSSYGPGFDLTSVVIPASVKKITDSTFFNCEKLTSVTFLGTGVTLGGFCFKGCINLTDLKFPDGENQLVPNPNVVISVYAFDVCPKLPLAVRAKLKAMGFKI